MKQKILRVVHLETGEIGTLATQANGKFTKRRFVKVFTDVRSPTLDKELSNFDVRVFMWLAEHMNWENHCVMATQYEIADSLGIHQPRVNLAIKALRAGGYIATPRMGVIEVSDAYASKGKEVVDDQPENAQEHKD